ncbi:MAG: ABC transporter permease [Acidobacteriia bacterium]|nr:ABC transporter permease [Terriglobia bacterium]
MTWLRGLFQRPRVEREIDDELAFHVEMETQANIARGMVPADARRVALGAFGGVAQAKELVREVRALRIESLCQDVRHAVRTLAAHRSFTLAAVGMLALGIGITTAMFTIVDSLVLRPVPFRDPGQLAHLWMGSDHGGVTLVSPAVVRAWRSSPAFVAVESAVSDTGLLEADNDVVTRGVATVTPGVFKMLGGVTPLRGRLFDPTEGSPGQSDRVLVSETAWRSLFGSDEALVGRPIRLDGERLTVIGILPANFRFPSASTVLWRPTDLGSGRGEPRRASRWNKTAKAYVRFAPGVPREDALRLATEAARAADSSTAGLRPWVYQLVDHLDKYSNRAIPLLAGGVVLVFLVLCANACSLLLARLTARRREFSLRAALGASRARLMRQALVESGVLGVLGMAVGAVIAWALVSVAQALLPAALLQLTLNPPSLDERALGATCIAGFVATLAAGLLPAWLGTKADAGDSLRVVDRSGTEARGARALTRGLLVGEVALACTLLVGATLLTRSFVNLATADRGFDTSGVTTLWLNLGETADGREALAQTLKEEFLHMPGVQQAAWSYGIPPEGGIISSGDWISDRPGAAPVNMTVARYIVSPEFFSLYGIPIIRGRTFITSDAPTNVIVSERLGQALWPGADPLGHTLRIEKVALQVVGIAKEINYPTLDSRDDGPELYQPYKKIGNTAMVSLRCGPSCPQAATIRRRLASTHPTVKVQDAGPLERAYSAQLVRPRAAAALAVTFAAVAVLAAAGGLFSVLSYAVSRRRREFGIRAALGASPNQIRRVVLRDGLLVATTGLAIGSLLAAALARGLASLQYGVTPYDPLSWAIVLGLIALTVLGACWRPARAAARLDPQLLLREE